MNSCTSPDAAALRARRLFDFRQDRRRIAQVVEVAPFKLENLGDAQASAPHDERRGAGLVPVVGRQASGDDRPDRRSSSAVHPFWQSTLYELCQKGSNVISSPRTTAAPEAPKMADFGANSATQMALHVPSSEVLTGSNHADVAQVEFQNFFLQLRHHQPLETRGGAFL